MISHHAVATFLPLAGLLLFAGCGGNSLTVYPVTGTVTLDGNPVEGAQVLFQAEGAPPAQGITDAAGKYTLKSGAAGEGAVAGNHRVTIVKMARAPGADPNDPYAVMQNILPPQYASATQPTLSAKVEAKTNDIPFALTTGNK